MFIHIDKTTLYTGGPVPQSHSRTSCSVQHAQRKICGMKPRDTHAFASAHAGAFTGPHARFSSLTHPFSSPHTTLALLLTLALVFMLLHALLLIARFSFTCACKRRLLSMLSLTLLLTLHLPALALARVALARDIHIHHCLPVTIHTTAKSM